MIFYFDRETGQRVSKSTWTRSKAHGGSRYVRRSDTTGRPKSAKSTTTTTTEQGAPSQAPRTFEEYIARYEDSNEDYEIEIETSVDY